MPIFWSKDCFLTSKKPSLKTVRTLLRGKLYQIQLDLFFFLKRRNNFQMFNGDILLHVNSFWMSFAFC